MNKLKLKKTGKEVKMGEQLIKVVNLCGIPIPIAQIEINKTTLPDLIKHGIIVVEGSDSDIDITIEGAIRHLANRIGWNKENLEKYLRNLYKISPAAAFEIVLKEVAILLDEKYPDHINNSKEIWVINKVNGEIQKLKDMSKIKSFQHFAAFRSLEDAKITCRITRDLLKEMFKSGK